MDNNLKDRYYLTDAEVSVLQYMADGLDSKQIANERFSKERTVIHQRQEIKRKMEVNNCYQAVAEGIRKGIID